MTVGWPIRDLQRRRSITIPELSAGFFFFAAYLYR
jgi:hypothetical protein